jgi:7-carboxy-7-deazaguanine synthase
VSTTIPVAEIFGPTIAGEGVAAGKRMHFLRVGGCDMLPTGACSWCDSMHAVDPARVRLLERLTQDEMLERVLALGGSTRTLTISGGNPCLYDLTTLCSQLRERDWELWVETQGSKYPTDGQPATWLSSWLDMCNVTVSPKPPSAGQCDIEALEGFIAVRNVATTGWETVIKIPVDPGFKDGADFYFAEMIFEQFGQHEGLRKNFCLSVVTYPSDTRDDILNRWETVIEWAKDASIPDVRVLPQLHAVLYGHRLGV